MPGEKVKKEIKRWMSLDNAAKIYPAAMRRDWTALFRISAQLTEPVDPVILKKAQKSVLDRFPTFGVRLRTGFFWYYLEHNEGEPYIQPDVANPCVRMRLSENRHFMFRVRCFENRIAVEIFHVLTDGTGGLIFLKTLVAEYLRLKYGAEIPRSAAILDCSEKPRAEEGEDAFVRYVGKKTRSRSEADSYYWRGTPEPPDLIHITTGIIPTKELSSRAKEKGATITEYLTAVMITAADALQRKKVHDPRFFKQVKVLVPVNLRNLFPSATLRNFANYASPGIDPAYGEFTLDEVLNTVRHQIGIEVTPKIMQAKFTTNVESAGNPLLRMVPLFVKNIAMRTAFDAVGDRKTTTAISNLGRQSLPDEMAKYVTRMDFILGPLSRTRVACAAIGYEDKLYINCTRTIKEPDLEREFFTRLVKLGIPVLIESNNRAVREEDE